MRRSSRRSAHRSAAGARRPRSASHRIGSGASTVARPPSRVPRERRAQHARTPPASSRSHSGTRRC
eukprot:scaffold127453_cov72-Phaeocystis_antarctica.AAC.1